MPVPQHTTSQSFSPDISLSKVLGPPPHNYIPPFRPNPPQIPPSNPDAPVSLVWFRGHDLRVHDHPALDSAIASGATIVALYVLECGPETDGANHYLRRRHLLQTPNLPPLSHHDSHSDVMSSVTTHSTSPHLNTFRPNTFREPITSRIPLETERYPWGPLSPNGGFALGRVQRWYLHYSLCVLRQQLHQLGITLVLRRVDCADDVAPVVVDIANSLGAGSVMWNNRYKPCAYPVDEAVSSSLRKLAVFTQQFDSETLMQPSLSLCGRYDDFQSYTRFWIDTMRACPPSRPNQPIEKSNVVAMERSKVHDLLLRNAAESPPLKSATNIKRVALPSVADLELLSGLSLEGLDAPGKVDAIGCVAARKAVSAFLQEDRFARFAHGTARRDGMVTGDDLATSRLSPHVRFGEISPRVLFYAIVDAGATAKESGNQQGLDAARTFLKNMSLREFGYYMLSRYPSAAYKPIMPEFEVFPWEEDEDGTIARAWETGTTGFPIVDAAMRQLLREGWLHNRMRFLAASFFCKYLLLPWPVGAAHLVRTLVDGDEACNSLGWQWTVGCNSDSFPFSTLVNPLSLYTHTQSRKRAAEYVRKYVPELAHLPDSLVFTPWKATEEERANYRLNFLPLRQYNKNCEDICFSKDRTGQSVFYPTRIVTGKDARLRARRAMEVMRRIFAAQRQCRTIIAEQELSGRRVIDRKHRRTAGIETSTKKQRTVKGVEMLDADGKPITQLDVSDLDSTASCVSDIAESRKSRERRKEERGEAETRQTPRKRRRTATQSAGNRRNRPLAPMGTPKICGRPMMSIAQLSSPPMDPNPRRPHSQSPCLTNGEMIPEVHVSRGGTGSESPKRSSDSGNGKAISPRNLKRPRPVTPNITQSAAARLSVKALLSPSLTHDASMIPHSSPSSLLQTGRGSPMISQQRANPLPNLAHVTSFGNPTSGNAPITNEIATPDLLSNLPSRYMHSSPPLPIDSRLPVTSNPRTPQISTTPRMHMKTPDQRNFNDRVHTAQSVGFPHHSPGPTFSYHSPAGLANATVPTQGPEGVRSMIGATSNPRGRRPQVQMKVDMPTPVPSFGAHRAAPSVFHPGVSPVPLMSNQYQHAQHPNAQVMVSFRPPPNSAMQVPPLNHAASAMASPNASQGYFAANPVGPNPHQPAGQQVLWYPALAPYVELRGHGLPGTVLPQMMHPMARAHPHGIPAGYPVPGATAIGTQDPSRMMSQAGLPVAFADADGSARRGPNSPIEREAIARRMAAMDYHDENYGGKHWEQWQAISLHLLNQYEFSDDTDRETSRAYVRLCDLKDELRDANRNGPRVTVNHCKEVFRILNLPVTGEWDRRGHGGVRGPYVYGCVKKSGAQVSRR